MTTTRARTRRSCGCSAPPTPGDAHAYGDDPWTERVTQELCELFGAAPRTSCSTGRRANVLGLSLLLRPYEAVICAETAHLNVDECGAPERLLGSKLLTVPTPDGKLTPDSSLPGWAAGAMSTEPSHGRCASPRPPS